MKTNKIILFIGILLCLIGFTSIVYADNLADRLSGRILLQVEENGEAWYVNPVNNERYFLGRPADAFKVMRNLGLGISNSNLDQIPIADTSNFPSEEITKVSIQDIRNAFTKKYPTRDYSSFTITIDKNYQDLYVYGNIYATAGGGHYWAAKVNGSWVIVQDTQDVPLCSLFEPYKFPADMTNTCR